MSEPAAGTDRVNSFAVVSYIPGPLGDFLTRLRYELVPGCVARAHVSVLPPRPLRTSVDEASEFFRRTVSGYSRFTVEMPAIQTFDNTLVVFLSVGRGFQEVTELHERLNTGPLFFPEPWPFHPHVTLAQGVSPERFSEIREDACQRWTDGGYGNTVEIEGVTFVQNTVSNCWVDLIDCELAGLTVPA